MLKIRQDLPEILEDNLVAIYLYGSLTYNAFNELKSDVDCEVVTKRNLSDEEFKVLKNWYKQVSKTNFWVKRLEMYYSTKQSVKRLGHKSEGAVYHNSKFQKIARSYWPNPITWFNIRKSGKVLYGADPKLFIPDVGRGQLLKALKMEVEYLEKRNPKCTRAPRDQAYAVLTLCRILYTLNQNTITSKTKAAQWCIKTMPEWSELIRLALKYRYSNSKKPNFRLQQLLPGYLELVQSRT